MSARPGSLRCRRTLMSTVLLVDDDELVRRSLVKLVESTGNLVWEAANGRDAL